MAGDKKGAARSTDTQNDRTKARTKTATDNAIGKGSKGGFGTGDWAKRNKVWKEGDTEGPK